MSLRNDIVSLALRVHCEHLVLRLYDTYSLKTKSSQCHYVMTLRAFGFEAKKCYNDPVHKSLLTL